MNDLDAEFGSFCDQWLNQGTSRFEKELVGFIEQHGLQGAFATGDKREFHSRALAIERWVGRWRHNRHLHQQLVAAGFPLLIFRSSGTCHRDLDGMILAAGDAFWRQGSSNGDPECDCHVTAAHTMAAAVRRGADPSKAPPEIRFRCVPLPGFRDAGTMRLSDCIAAFDAGLHRRVRATPPIAQAAAGSGANRS